MCLSAPRESRGVARALLQNSLLRFVDAARGRLLFDLAVSNDTKVVPLEYVRSAGCGDRGAMRSSAVMTWCPFGIIKHRKIWTTVVDLPFLERNDKTEYHHRFLFDHLLASAAARTNCKICAYRSPTMVCKPYVLISAEKLADVKMAYQQLAVWFHGHFACCNCGPSVLCSNS